MRSTPARSRRDAGRRRRTGDAGRPPTANPQFRPSTTRWSPVYGRGGRWSRRSAWTSTAATRCRRTLRRAVHCSAPPAVGPSLATPTTAPAADIVNSLRPVVRRSEGRCDQKARQRAVSESTRCCAIGPNSTRPSIERLDAVWSRTVLAGGPCVVAASQRASAQAEFLRVD